MLTKLLLNQLPPDVHEMVHPPEFVYVARGKELDKPFTWPEKSLAVIGSRNMSDYGKDVVWDLIPRLVLQGWVIISGLAEGIDGEAHKAALEMGGTTGAVLGFGIMKLDTFSNRELGKRILQSEKGFLVSQFEPYQRAEKWTFLERNRLTAALSNAILVVESAAKSGCTSTVEAALELGKDVYVVPGNIFSYTSMGCNELIKQGARVVTCVEDILA